MLIIDTSIKPNTTANSIINNQQSLGTSPNVGEPQTNGESTFQMEQNRMEQPSEIATDRVLKLAKNRS
jgi:hypothetical protein